MAFDGYVCWNRTNVADTVTPDAAAPLDSVFLATHHPARISRRPIEAASGGEVLTEKQVLEDLLESTADPLIMPITGSAGSGKSHLVRWLRAALDPNDSSRHVVYLSKYRTNLRGVIYAIIEGFEGPSFDAVRVSLHNAADSLDEARAPEELLNQLAVAFNTWKPADVQHADYDYQRYLAGSNGISQLLYDNIFRESLLAEGGVIQRLVRQALHGKERSDDEEPFQFDVEDLPTGVERISEASLPAKQFFRQFSGSPELQRVAAEQLTEFLQPSIRQLIGVRGNELSDIFLRVRELLGQENKELILLIEDFSILQGIQRELLDVLTVQAVHQGERRFCRLRTVMAVTTGYFGPMYATVRSRAHYIYNLDVRATDVSADEATSFVARYLNAARFGQDAIDKARRGEERGEKGDWVPNACNACAYQTLCHASFGTSREGFGLYPFNEPALARAIASKIRGEVANFEPREVLRGVVEYVLDKQIHAIEQGQFPNENLKEHFANSGRAPLPGLVEQAIDERDARDASRRKVLLTFWGDAPNKVANLPEGVHIAFGIPPLADVHELSATGTPVSPPLVPDPDSTSDMEIEQPVSKKEKGAGQDKDEEMRGVLEEIASWRDGSEFRQSTQRNLRSRLQEAIIGRLNWEGVALFPQELAKQGGRFSPERIHFSEPPRRDPLNVALVIERSHVGDRLALEALVLIDHYGHWHFDNGSKYRRNLVQAVDRWSNAVENQLRLAEDQVSFENAVHALAIGAAVVGVQALSGTDPAGQIEALLHIPSEVEARGITNEWEALRTACLVGDRKADSRQKLISRMVSHSGTAKGGSGPQAIDAAAILRVLAQRLPEIGQLPKDLGQDGASQHLQKAISLIDSAISESRRKLEGWKLTVDKHLGTAVEHSQDILDTLLAAVAEAGRVIGVEPANAYEKLSAVGLRFLESRPQELLQQVTNGLQDYSSMDLMEKLVFIGGLEPRRLEAVEEFVVFADHVLNTSEKRLRHEREDAPDKGGPDVVAVRQEIIQELQRCGDELSAIGSEQA
jgi:HPt (histidine-containing phosphotransfer) domain-containing protein